MTDAQGNQLTYRQIAERMTLKAWVPKEEPTPVPSGVERVAEQVQRVLPVWVIASLEDVECPRD
jgi:hypothetical protein